MQEKAVLTVSPIVNDRAPRPRLIRRAVRSAWFVVGHREVVLSFDNPVASAFPWSQRNVQILRRRLAAKCAHVIALPAPAKINASPNRPSVSISSGAARTFTGCSWWESAGPPCLRSPTVDHQNLNTDSPSFQAGQVIKQHQWCGRMLV